MATLTESQRKTLEKLYDGKIGREALAEKSGIGVYQCRMFIHRKKLKNVEALAPTVITPKQQALELIDKLRERQSVKEHKALLLELAETQTALDTVLAVKSIPYIEKRINVNHDSKRSTVATIVLSDAHIEEVVKPATINNLNCHNPIIAEDSMRQAFVNGGKLVKKEQHGANIDELVVAILGDMLSGALREEALENNASTAIVAIGKLRTMLADGLNHLLQHFDGRIRVVCCVGNHGRTTQKIHHASQATNSYEYLLYHMLRHEFAKTKRIVFVIEEGYHTYLNMAGHIVRFHHGHYIKYKGGVGGVTVPLRTSIAEWNKSCRADLDVLGHFHSMHDGGYFLINGSLIGYNAYAISIKAGYEPPRQLFFLMDSKYGKGMVTPIHIDRKW